MSAGDTAGEAAGERVAALHELDDAVPHSRMLADGRRICLVRCDDSVFAFEDRCPHRDFALSGGELVEPCVIECPWHGARFDVRTGAALQGPATDDLVHLPVRIVGDDVVVG